MIDEQLFKRVLDTLKTNNDAVIVAVADEGGKNCKFYLNGSDELLIPMIDTISQSYIEDVIKDEVEPDGNKSKLDNVDEMLKQLQNYMSSKDDNGNKADDLTKQIQDALEEIDWDELFGEDGINGQN